MRVAALLLQRTQLAQQAALWKKLHGAALQDPRREAHVRLHYASRLVPGGWSPDDVRRLGSRILSASKRAQAHLTVAIQGDEGSWSEESLRTVLPNIGVACRATFPDALEEVLSGRSAAAWLPVHNSTVGAIDEAATLASRLEPWFELAYPVRHALIAPKGVDLAHVSRLEGHPRALQQCAHRLRGLLPRAQLVPVADGARAAKAIRSGAVTAVVGSPRVASLYGLSVLAENVCDAADNTTTFRLLVAPGSETKIPERNTGEAVRKDYP